MRITFVLTLSILGKNSVDDSLKYSSYFHQKKRLAFRANCLQFVWNVKVYFLKKKKKKMKNIINLSSAEFDQIREW